MSAQVVVLNADYLPHQVVPLKHAIRMMVRGVVDVEESEEGRKIGPYPFPKVVRLVKYVYLKFTAKRGAPKYSRMGVLRRDDHKCAYCTKHATTIDHVLPRSRGGGSTWLNTVAACRRCNERKADKTPEEANMKLLNPPYTPSFYELTR